jgi:hypothetical protein
MFGKKPLTLFRHPGLYLELVQDKGRGVFCQQDLKAREVLEVAPLILFPVDEHPALLKTTLVNYVFGASHLPEPFLKSAGYDNPESALALPMGITSICNHLAEPNAEYDFKVDDMSPFAILRASRDIPKGEEICVSYGNTWFMKRTISAHALAK